MDYKKALVCGSGTMGPGIALGFAMGGVDVSVTDIDSGALTSGRKSFERGLDLFESQGMISEGDRDEISGRIEFTSDLKGAAKDTDLAIEAVSEDPETKEKVLRELDSLLKPDAIIGSNTSTLPLPEMYPDIRPGRLIIIHYFNPPHIMPLVEIVRGKETPDDAIAALRKFYRKTGKYVVVLNKFLPGFLVNRIQLAVMRETLHLLGEGLAEPEEIDTAFKCCSAFRGVVHGPFEHMDMIGIDVINSAAGFVFPLLSSSTEVPEAITDLFNKGRLGYKGKGGFYDYPEETKEEHILKRDRALTEELKLFNKLVSKGDIKVKE
jgi:3-hydroxybutyryl-CoA dehydrogenase